MQGIVSAALQTAVSRTVGALSRGMTPGIFVPNGRNIGGIVAQVTVEEREHDELVITEHPVEQGAHINDHAFKRPSEVTIKAGWSASGAGDISATGNGVYSWLLNLQAALRPFDLYTGKRVYHDMLIQSLMVTTDSKSEFALMADITCRQVILVRTQTAQTSISNDTSKQEEPEKTATEDKKGEQATRAVGTGQNGFSSIGDKHEDTGTAVAMASPGQPTVPEVVRGTEQAFPTYGDPSIPAAIPEADKVEGIAKLNAGTTGQGQIVPIPPPPLNPPT